MTTKTRLDERAARLHEEALVIDGLNISNANWLRLYSRVWAG